MRGKIKPGPITFTWKQKQVTRSFLVVFLFYFYFSGRSLNSFPASSGLKFSGKVFQFGTFSIGTLLNIIASLRFSKLHCTLFVLNGKYRCLVAVSYTRKHIYV